MFLYTFISWLFFFKGYVICTYPKPQHPNTISQLFLSSSIILLFLFSFTIFFSLFYLWVSKVSTYPSGTKNISLFIMIYSNVPFFLFDVMIYSNVLNGKKLYNFILSLELVCFGDYHFWSRTNRVSHKNYIRKPTLACCAE